MRSISILILALSVIYGGFCAVGVQRIAFANSNAMQASHLSLQTTVAKTTLPSCHSEQSESKSKSIPAEQERDSHCCEMSSAFAVSSWPAQDIELAWAVSHFFVMDLSVRLPIARELSMTATSVDPT